MEAESTFTALMAESTTFESVFIQQEVFQALIDQSLVQQELAALQYQETYARAKRIAVGEAYNVAILEEVQNVSSLNGLARASAGPDATIQLQSVNMNSQLIQQASQRIQTLNAFINSYTNIYSEYDAQIQNMSSLSTTVGNKQTAVNTLAQRNQALLDQIYKSTTGSRSAVPDSAVISAYNEGDVAFRTRRGEADISRGKVQTARHSINTIIQTYRQTYESIFTPTERLEHETTISSFLIAGYNLASLQPAPTA
jgi:soluble cytochrome b562